MSLTALLGASRTSVNTWVANYLADGLNGLLDKPKPGQPNQLSHQLEQLKKFIEKNAIKQDGAPFTPCAWFQSHPGSSSTWACGCVVPRRSQIWPKRQDFGQNGVAVPVPSNSSSLIMGICLGQSAQVTVKRKHWLRPWSTKMPWCFTLTHFD